MSIENELSIFNKYTDELTEYTYELKSRAGDNMLQYFADLRQMPIEEVTKSDIFYIDDATEMLLPKYINRVESFGVISPTNKKPIFHNRFVIPIKDTDNRVLNLVGYSKEANERYVYGTAKYYRRRETMYGLENLQLAYELGYKVSFANCGTHKSDFIMKQLNRCRFGVIKIPDRDAPGKKASDGWKTYRGITLNTFIAYKDIDEMCKESEHNRETVKVYLDTCINWITSMEHRGYTSQNEIITMYI